MQTDTFKISRTRSMLLPLSPKINDDIDDLVDDTPFTSLTDGSEIVLSILDSNGSVAWFEYTVNIRCISITCKQNIYNIRQMEEQQVSKYIFSI